MKKKVSVVMCTYNGAKYIREQLDSIINQTYPIFEIIIQDDCSTDDTVDIIREYAETHSNIRLFQNEKSLGINRNFFSAMNRAKGDYIAISDQDDIWEKDKIEVQVKAIGDAWLSSGFSKPFTSDRDIKIHFDSRMPNYTLGRMVYVGMTPGHTLLIKKELLEYIPDLDRWIDLYTYDKHLQIVAASYDKVQFCNKVLVHNRRHISAATYGPAENYQRTFSNIFQSIRRTYSLYKEVRPFMREYFSNTYKFLAAIPNQSVNKEKVMKMVYFQSQQSLWAYLRLTIICIQLRDEIFHAKEKNPIVAVLRAIYFPISCSDYFRYKSSKYKK